MPRPTRDIPLPPAPDPRQTPARPPRPSRSTAPTPGPSAAPAPSPATPILLRNPHLAWDAGYYEAHVRRARRPRLLRRLPHRRRLRDHRRLQPPPRLGHHQQLPDVLPGLRPRRPTRTTRTATSWTGARTRCRSGSTTVEYRTADGGLGTETRSTWWTPYGPVIHRDGRPHLHPEGPPRRGMAPGRAVPAHDAGHRPSTSGWTSCAGGRTRRRTSPTPTRTGTSRTCTTRGFPSCPTRPPAIRRPWPAPAPDIWSGLVPFDDLPLYLDPPGGYVQQENDTPDYTNLNVPMDRDTMPANLPAAAPAPAKPARPRAPPRRRRQLSLEDVVALKHTPRMLVAERVMDELIAAVRASNPDGDVAEALPTSLERWDRTASARQPRRRALRDLGGPLRARPSTRPASSGSRGRPERPDGHAPGDRVARPRRRRRSRGRRSGCGSAAGPTTCPGARCTA